MDLFGGAKNTTKSKKIKKTSDSKKKTTKTAKTSDAKKTKKSSTTTRSKSKTKGGNFLGTVGDLVAPTGWGPFATAAGLLALDRADAALRRRTKEKKEKMKGGLCQEKQPGQIQQVTIGPNNFNGNPTGNIYSYYPKNNLKEYRNLQDSYPNWPNENQNIVIKCNKDGKYYYEVNIKCNNEVKTYKHLPPEGTRNPEIYFFDDFEAAYKNAKLIQVQKSLIKLALSGVCKNKL